MQNCFCVLVWICEVYTYIYELVYTITLLWVSLLWVKNINSYDTRFEYE